MILVWWSRSPIPFRVVWLRPCAHRPQINSLPPPHFLKVLLVSDPDCDKAGAAMDVSVGALDDPADREGLAHFLEHMLFLGMFQWCMCSRNTHRTSTIMLRYPNGVPIAFPLLVHMSTHPESVPHQDPQSTLMKGSTGSTCNSTGVTAMPSLTRATPISISRWGGTGVAVCVWVCVHAGVVQMPLAGLLLCDTVLG